MCYPGKLKKNNKLSSQSSWVIGEIVGNPHFFFFFGRKDERQEERKWWKTKIKEKFLIDLEQIKMAFEKTHTFSKTVKILHGTYAQSYCPQSKRCTLGGGRKGDGQEGAIIPNELQSSCVRTQGGMLGKGHDFSKNYIQYVTCLCHWTLRYCVFYSPEKSRISVPPCWTLTSKSWTMC